MFPPLSLQGTPGHQRGTRDPTGSTSGDIHLIGRRGEGWRGREGQGKPES